MAASHGFQVLIKRQGESCPHSFSEQNPPCLLTRVAVGRWERGYQARSAGPTPSFLLPVVTASSWKVWGESGHLVVAYIAIETLFVFL